MIEGDETLAVLERQHEFVVEHGRLELLLAVAQLLRELFGLVQVTCQLGLTYLNSLNLGLNFRAKVE